MTTTKRKAGYKTAEKVIKGILSEHFGSTDPKDWGDVGFYTPQAWRARGEKYGVEGILVMTFEGPVYAALNYGEPNWNLHTKLHEGLKAAGLWFEQGHAWNFAVYHI